MVVVGHLLTDRGGHLIEASHLGQRDRLDRAVLHRRRADQIRQLDATITRCDRRLEFAQPQVLPHHPEAVGVELHGVATLLEPGEQRFRCLSAEPETTAVHRRRLGVEQQILVADLLRQPQRLLDVGDRDRRVVLPVVGEPRSR